MPHITEAQARANMENGFNTRKPPSEHAMDCLRQIRSYGADGMPAQEINFTVRNKLAAFEYITLREARSAHWYSTHGPERTVTFMFITEKGKAAL